MTKKIDRTSSFESIYRKALRDTPRGSRIGYYMHPEDSRAIFITFRTILLGLGENTKLTKIYNTSYWDERKETKTLKQICESFYYATKGKTVNE